MNIIYLINSKKYNYHKSLATDFTGVTGGVIIDTGGADPGSLYYDIKERSPDIVITFDLAGHVFRTGNDTLSLNNIYARFAHILFHRPDHYARELKARQNLSMFTYIPEDEDLQYCRSYLPDVPNVESFVPFCYKPANDMERADNIENIKLWWNEFKKDAML